MEAADGFFYLHSVSTVLLGNTTERVLGLDCASDLHSVSTVLLGNTLDSTQKVARYLGLAFRLYSPTW